MVNIARPAGTALPGDLFLRPLRESSYACGMCDNWLYLGFIRQLHVRQWLDENGLDLGSSDESAHHWLIADASTGDLFAVPVREAHAVVRAQRLPSDGEQAPRT